MSRRTHHKLRPRLAFHVDGGAAWVGVQVLPGWVIVQPLPCIGVSWRRW